MVFRTDGRGHLQNIQQYIEKSLMKSLPSNNLTLLLAITLLLVFHAEPGNALRFPLDHSELYNSSAQFRNSSNGLFQEEAVGILIRALHSDSSLVEYSIQTLQDIDKLQKFISTLPKDFELVIERASQHSIVLYLSPNSHIITKGFIRKYYTDTGEPITKHIDDKGPMLSGCFFTGKVLGNVNSLVSLNLCNGVKGVVEISERIFYIETVIKEASVDHNFREVVTNESSSSTCANKEKKNSNPSSHSMRHRNRFTRELKLPAGSSPKTKYIELYLVMDNALYRRTGSVDATFMRGINIVNYASALYKQLDIYLALVGIEVWNDRNKIPYQLAEGSNDEYDPDSLLGEFNKYRLYNLVRQTPNDNSQLLSGVDFEGGTIGKGSTGTICTHTNSGGVTYDEYENNYVRAASTMSHEMGHNLRMSHSDEEETYQGIKCECDYPGDPDFKSCIMYSSSSPYKQATKWSECTKMKLEADLANNIGACLENKPENVTEVGNTAVCGNFYVEEGEECDCGQPADCKSKCCDAVTCKLHSNATCATGACCDLDTCSIHVKSTPCHLLQDSECDLEEFCDGSSEWCPSDTYKLDGTPCNNKGDAYCYSGKCNSRNSQCNFVWGLAGSRSAEDICYTELNNRGRYYGNCGWETDTADSGPGYLERNFISCATEQDKFCGLLHCDFDQKPDDSLSTRVVNFPLVKFKQPVNDVDCYLSAFDVGYKEYDPGQVPDGAKCADNSMCINSRCVSVPTKPQSCECNGHGVCNQNNECHCDVGWAPPYCKTWGYGGSKSSNPSTVRGKNLRLIAGLIAFFCGIVPLGLVIVIVGYRRRRTLKEKYHRIVSRFKKHPQTIRQPRLAFQISVVEGRNEPQATVPSRGLESGSTPLPNSSNGVTDRVKRLNGSAANKNVISSPVLQSTSNHGYGMGQTHQSQSSQIKHSSPSHAAPVRAAPTRAAPPPPNIPNRSHPPQAAYENVNPRIAPKPKRPNPAAKPAVLPKPKISR